MKDRLRSSQSSSNHNQEHPFERSHYESPKKERLGQGEEGERLGEEVQYKLEKVFEEAGNREERYVSLIKDQQEKLRTQGQQYLESLREIKKEFLHFISSTTSQQTHIWKALKLEPPIKSKPMQRLNSLEFTPRLLREQEKDSPSVPQLQCRLSCYYYTPFAEDCLRFQMPGAMTLRVRGLWGGGVIGQEIRVVAEEDEADNLNCLLNRVPFQIATIQDQPILFNFKIPCTYEAISHYRRQQIQIELIDHRGMFVSSYGKLSLNSLLFYEQQPTEWQLRPVQLFSPIEGGKVGELAVKVGNRLVYGDRQQNYKVQSSAPMEIGHIKQQISYNDQESRVIQRISKFKTATHSLLLGIGNPQSSSLEGDTDRTVLMHRQKKELQSIQQYKNSHKSQLMDRLFNDAIDRYFLNQCEVGTPRFLLFSFRNNDRDHKKIIGKIEVLCKGNEEGRPGSISALGVQQHIQASLVGPKQLSLLQQQGLIVLQEHANCEYDFDEQEQSLWALSGMTHTIVVKVIVLPLKSSQNKEEALKGHYELKLTLQDDYGQIVENFHSKLKVKQPLPEHTLYVHGYCDTQSQIEIPFQQGEEVLRKTILSNLPNIQYKWNPSFTSLSLKLAHRTPGQKQYFLTINDSQSLYSISRYIILLHSYPRLTHSLILQLGEVRKVSLEFSLDEQALTQRCQEVETLPSSTAKTAKDHVRVQFVSSRPEHCVVSCEGQTEIVCQLNKKYQMEAKLQTFDAHTNPERILLHAFDLDRRVVLRRWLLCLEKQSTQSFRQVLKLSCQHNKPLKYKFELSNDENKQKSFRLYSSNLSILATPTALIPLISNQRINAELVFHVRIAMSAEDALQPLKVVLTVTDGSTFSNYLFELNVRIK